MTRSEFDYRFSPPTKSRSHTWLSLCMAVLPVIVAVCLSGFIFFKGTAGFPIEKTQDCFVVSKVDMDLNPVQAGDCITHISGVAYHEVLGYLLTGKSSADQADRIVLQREGQTIHLTLRYGALKLGQFITSAGPYLLFTLLSLILCISVLHRAPAGQPVGLFVLTLSNFTLLFVCQFPIQFGILYPPLQSGAALTTMATNWLGFSAWLHFTLRFPVEQQLWQGKPLRIAAAVYLMPPVAAIALSWLLSGSDMDFFGWLQRLRRWAVPLIIVAIVAKQWHDLRAATAMITRNQMRLILTGSATGISIYLFLYLLPSLLIDRPLVPFYVVALSAVLIPLSLFLALIRYRLLDVDRMISWTISHMILIGIFIAAYSGGLVGLKHVMWGRGLASEGFFILFMVLIAFFFTPLKDRLQRAIDVLFFQQKIDYRKVLHTFSSKVAAAIRMSDLTELIVKELPQAFNLRHACLMVAAGDKKRIYPEKHSARQVIERLQAIPQMLITENSFLIVTSNHPNVQVEQELESLRQRDFQLVFRLRSRTAFIGMLLLGPQRNNAVYSGRDIQVLTILANQVATAMENALNYESLEVSQAALKRMFTKMVHAEKLATIGEMTAVLAHEIKNPLGVIRSSAQFLAAEQHPQENRDELLGFIIDEVDRLTQVVNNLLGLARYAPPDFKSVSLQDLLTALLDRWQQAEDHNPRIAIDFRCQAVEPILADRQQLIQIFMNLIRNSEDAMPEGGWIAIQADNDPRNDGVVIRFEDSGPGVAPEEVQKLWQKFYTTKQDGVGLGLPVCKQIVQAHGGGIEITSAKEKGFCVTIHLPRRPEGGLPATIEKIVADDAAPVT